MAADACPPGWPFSIEWIQLASSGIDSYPAWMFSGPIVTTARGISAVPVAEFALAAILAEAKRFPALWIDSPTNWRPTPWLSMVDGAVLGLFGFGAIGQALAPRALALGMSVIATRNTQQPIELPGVQRVDGIVELVSQADHLVLAAPLSPATKHVLSREVLAHAKHGLHIINVARGELIHDEALLAALDCGQVGRATLDVTAPEPLPAGHRFYAHPSVRLSPHASVHTPSTAQRFAAKFLENLLRFRAGVPLLDSVAGQPGSPQAGLVGAD
jgi:phosphoglycerate dehydrogenase-like enzyme